MLGMVSFYDPKKHALVGGDINAYVRRLDAKLFVVRYNELSVFCICRWLAGPKDIFIDVMNLGKSLANFDSKKSYELNMRIFKPLTCDQTSRQISESESGYHHARQDMNEEETERQEKVARGE